jgi:peptidase E
MEPDTPLLDDFVLSLARGEWPRVCFVGTAGGDAERDRLAFFRAFAAKRCRPSDLPLFGRSADDLRPFVLAQDVIYVGGGSTANLLAVWRVHGLDALLREAHAAGTVLCGISAGMNCWFEASVTDSFGGVAALRDGLGLLAGSACPHFDGEPGRRPAYLRLVAEGFPEGHAADDGAALHFRDGRLVEAVSSRPGARAFRVARGPDGTVESPLPTRFLGRA